MNMTPIHLPENYDICIYEEIDSTNEEAKRLIKSAGYEKAIIWSLSQEEGRGRYNKEWISPEGNLYVSLIITPTQAVKTLAQVSFVAAIAIREAILPFLPKDTTIEYKWPNDVLINSKKTAGILLESVTIANADIPDRLIIGIGINIENHPEGTEMPATSLKAEGADSIALEEILAALVWHFEDKFTFWEQNGFESIRKSWRRNAKGIGEEIAVHLANSTFSGTFLDLSPEGELQVKLTNGEIRSITAGEVFFGNNHS